MRVIAKFGYVCLFMIFFLPIGSTWGQTELFALTEDQQDYADALNSILKDWEAGKIEFTKDEGANKIFSARLEEFGIRRSQDDVERVFPMEFIAENWNRLPATVKPQRPLSTGAYLLLIAGVVDATEEFKNRGIDATPESMLRELEFPLYLTLGAAEEEANKKGSKTIDSINIRRGGVKFFSLGWPFCCAE